MSGIVELRWASDRNRLQGHGLPHNGTCSKEAGRKVAQGSARSGDVRSNDPDTLPVDIDCYFLTRTSFMIRPDTFQS